MIGQYALQSGRSAARDRHDQKTRSFFRQWSEAFDAEREYGRKHDRMAQPDSNETPHRQMTLRGDGDRSQYQRPDAHRRQEPGMFQPAHQQSPDKSAGHRAAPKDRDIT